MLAAFLSESKPTTHLSCTVSPPACSATPQTLDFRSEISGSSLKQVMGSSRRLLDGERSSSLPYIRMMLGNAAPGSHAAFGVLAEGIQACAAAEVLALDILERGRAVPKGLKALAATSLASEPSFSGKNEVLDIVEVVSQQDCVFAWHITTLLPCLLYQKPTKSKAFLSLAVTAAHTLLSM